MNNKQELELLRKKVLELIQLEQYGPAIDLLQAIIALEDVNRIFPF